MTKTFTNNPIANDLKGSAWFQRPSASPSEPEPVTKAGTLQVYPPPTASEPAHTAATKPAKKTTKSTSINSAKEASEPQPQMRANMHAHIHASMHAYMHATINEKATNSFAFRYPPEVLEKLEDVLHEIKKQHRRKLTKNVVAVAAMAFLLSDFEANGEESVLYQLLVEQPE